MGQRDAVYVGVAVGLRVEGLERNISHTAIFCSTKFVLSCTWLDVLLDERQVASLQMILTHLTLSR